MARDLAREKGREEEFAFLELLEERAVENFMNFKGNKVNKRVCANVDFYSGFVYEMIGLPSEVFTPLFAMSRITGFLLLRRIGPKEKGKSYRAVRMIFINFATGFEPSRL